MSSNPEFGNTQHDDASSWGDTAEQLRQTRLRQLEMMDLSQGFKTEPSKNDTTMLDRALGPRASKANTIPLGSHRGRSPDLLDALEASLCQHPPNAPSEYWSPNSYQESDSSKNISAESTQQYHKNQTKNQMAEDGGPELMELKRKVETDHRLITRAERHEIIMAKRSGNWKHPPKVDKNEIIITKPPKVPSRAHLHRRAANNPPKSSSLPIRRGPTRTGFSNPNGGHRNDQSSGILPPDADPYSGYPSPYTQSTHPPTNAPTPGLILPPHCQYCNYDITEIERVTGGRFPNACPSCGYPRSYLPATQQQSLASDSVPLLPIPQEESPIGFAPAPPVAQTSHHLAQQATLANIVPPAAPMAMRKQTACETFPISPPKSSKRQRWHGIDFVHDLGPILTSPPTTSKEAKHSPRTAGQMPVEENERTDAVWKIEKEVEEGKVTPQSVTDSSLRSAIANRYRRAGNHEVEQTEAALEGARSFYDGGEEVVIEEEEEEGLTNRDDDVYIKEGGAGEEIEEEWWEEEEEVCINSEDEV